MARFLGHSKGSETRGKNWSKAVKRKMEKMKSPILHIQDGGKGNKY